MGEPRRGLVTGSYATRGGETVWIIAWDDRQNGPPLDVRSDGMLNIGQRVQLVGDLLVPIGGRQAA